MKKVLSILLCVLLLAALAGCGSPGEETEPADNSSAVRDIPEEGGEACGLNSVFLVTNVYGDGQKPWYLVLEYDQEIRPDSVSPEDYQAEGYDLAAVYVNDQPDLPEESVSGSYVILELDTDYTTADYGGSSVGFQGGMNGNGDLPEEGGFADVDGAPDIEEPEGTDSDESEQPDRSGRDRDPEDGLQIPDREPDGDYHIPEDGMDSTMQVPEGSASADVRVSGDVPENGTFDGRSEDDLPDPGDREPLEDGSGDEGSPSPDGGMRQDAGMGGGRGDVDSVSSMSNQITVTFRQTGELTTVSGETVEAWGTSVTTDSADNVNLLVDDFQQDTLTLSDGTELTYSLYLPEHYSETGNYPLVLFMPDATGEGSDPYLALTESLGGVIWASQEWQSEQETVVLVPQYEDGNTEDPAYTMELVQFISDSFSVDPDREYLVGQSSGTIRALKLMIDWPDTFAGALLVAGQTDSDYTDQLAQLAGAHIWMICSEGDVQAYPGMTEIAEALETAGTAVTTAQWSAQLEDGEQEELAAEQAAEGTAVNWTIYDAGTVMRDDVTASDATEHMNTWRVAYDLSTVREWLFAQTLA